MAEDIIFDELGLEERKLLLQAFDYTVDDNGFIVSSTGKRIISDENPETSLHVSSSALIPGSLCGVTVNS